MGRASRTFWNPLNGVWRLARRWQRTAAAGQRVCGDLGRQWQSGKGPQTGFVSWCRCRATCSRWPGKAVAKRQRPTEWFCVVMGRASRTFWNPLNGVWRLARRWQRTAAAGQRARGDLGRQWQRVWCLVDHAGRGPSRPKPHTCGDPGRRPAWAKARQGSADYIPILNFTSFFLLK